MLMPEKLLTNGYVISYFCIAVRHEASPNPLLKERA